MARKKNSDVVEPQEIVPVEEQEKPVKKKGRPRGGNSPVIGNNGLQVEPGDNAKYMQINRALLKMKDIDLNDEEAVQQRLDEYFDLYASYDTKPTVVGMAIALNGHSRQWLWAVVNNQPLGGMGNLANLRPAVTDTIKRAYFLMENSWETYMQNGKINPVSGIFLGKNNFGYQDKTEYVLTPNTNGESEINPDEIRERYMLKKPNDSDDHSDEGSD